MKLVANQPANHQYTEYRVYNSASGRQLNEYGWEGEKKKITNKPTDAKIDYKCTNDINMQKFTVKQR